MLGKRRLGIIAFATMLAASLLPVSGAFAQTGGTVVADGLANPRGVAVGDDGSVYVAEAGNGGDQVLKSDLGEVHWGYTGQLTKLASDGTKSVVAKGFASGNSEEGSTGLHDIIWANGALWGVIGGITGGNPKVVGENTVVRIDATTGMTQTVADLGAYEAAKNPAGFAVDSDLYGIALGPDNMIYVADAAGNDILKVDPASGSISTVAVIPGIPVPADQAPPGGNPERGGANELDPVPTGLAFGPDGNLYVSLLSGGPFPPGAASVMKVTMDGKVSVAAPGLSMATDIALGPDGNWYVAEFARFNLQSTPPGFDPHSGDVVRISPNGARSVIAAGLDFPNKLAFDSSGNLYVSVLSVTPAGQVLRFDNATNIAGITPGMPTTGEPVNWPLAGMALGLVLAATGALLRRKHALSL